MRILIVNGYNATKQGILQFNLFRQYIYKFLTEQRELVDTENEYFIRDRNTIEDFLYEIESSYVKKDSATNFDQADLIFVSGDSKCKPWSKSLIKILTLLRMCLKVNKLVFASSWAMFALVYLAASNLDYNINIINGENGSKLSSIRTIPKALVTLRHQDYFLDNTTGDLYNYNYELSQWIPRTNVGLHYRQAAQEFQSIGKYIVKAPQYKPKNSQNQQIYKNRNSETITELKKAYYHHWALHDVEHTFLTPLLNSWDVHTFSFTNSQKTFICLAESDEGPSIIQFKSILAVSFDIDPKYSETSKILKNFIINSIKLIMSRENKDFESIIHYHLTVKQSSLQDQLRKQHEKEVIKQRNKILKNDFQSGITDPVNEEDELQNKVHHVGFSLNKRKFNDRVVKFNSVHSGIVKMKDIGSVESKRKNSSQFGQTVYVYNDELNDEQAKEKQHKRFYTQGEIRSLLHPSISQSCLDFKGLWIPGQMSKNTKQRKSEFHQKLKKIGGFDKI